MEPYTCVGIPMVKQQIPEVMQSEKVDYEICTLLEYENTPNHLQGSDWALDCRNVQLIFGLLHPFFLCLVRRRQPDGSMLVYKRTHKPRLWSNNVLPCVLSLHCVLFTLTSFCCRQASNNKLAALCPTPRLSFRSFVVRGRWPRIAPLLAKHCPQYPSNTQM